MPFDLPPNTPSQIDASFCAVMWLTVVIRDVARASTYGNFPYQNFESVVGLLSVLKVASRVVREIDTWTLIDSKD